MNFELYFNLGIEHITDLNGYDHILFIIAICTNYRILQWKELAVLVTAFTIGHSLSLALAVLNFVSFNPALIEFLIPLTILSTGIHNIIKLPKPLVNAEFKTDYTKYLLVLLFGLIHGLGFSNFLKETLVQNESIFTPLLAFNLGLEIGQLLIVFLFLLLNFLFLNLLRKEQRDWSLFVSGAISSVAFLIAVEKFKELFSN
jgi:hypothetical protein